jgi:NAD(P)H-flavin reductase
MLWRLNVLTEHAGMVGGVAFILILLTSLSPIRKRFYELFSALHHLLAALVIITAGIHRPDISKKALIIVIVTGAMWALDKGLRHARWLYHWHGNHATIIPLPNGATKVVMRRCLSATPGSKVFLWLPSVGFFERHPFTLVTNEPRAAFVIKSQNGFTRRLHARAHQYPGEKFYASIEGPYGRAPDPKLFDKVLLIAGGSGVTFTMSLALNWSRKRDRANHAQTLDFVWIVKDESCLEWFATELQELRSDPSMHIKLFVTQRSSPALSIDYAHSEFEKTLHEVELGGGGDDDVEKAVSRTASVRSSASLRSFARPGRPDLYQTVAQAIAGLKESHRILIAGCGPPGMVKGVQKVVRQCPAQDSPDFSLFFETFKY